MSFHYVPDSLQKELTDTLAWTPRNTTPPETPATVWLKQKDGRICYGTWEHFFRKDGMMWGFLASGWVTWWGNGGPTEIVEWAYRE